MMFLLVGGALAFAFAGYADGLEAAQRDATGKPFTVYETDNACVFITGGGGQPVSIAAFPKARYSNQLIGWGC